MKYLINLDGLGRVVSKLAEGMFFFSYLITGRV